MVSCITWNRIVKSGSQNYYPNRQAWSIHSLTTTNTNFWICSKLRADMHHTVSLSLHLTGHCLTRNYWLCFLSKVWAMHLNILLSRQWDLLWGVLTLQQLASRGLFWRCWHFIASGASTDKLLLLAFLPQGLKNELGLGTTLLSSCSCWGVNSVLGSK